MIGALSLSGEINSALSLFKEKSNEFNKMQMNWAFFFLIIGNSRLSRYEEAKSYLSRLLHKRKQFTTPQEKFCFFQSIGFICYITGKFGATARWAERALQQAHLCRLIFAEILAIDLLGYANVRIGEISRGLSLLREAIRLAEQIGQAGTVDALRVSLTIYYARYRWSPLKSIKLLNKMFKRLKVEDNYSRANLLIEIAEVYKNSGNLQKSYEILSEVAVLIYSHQNYRQEALLNLKFSYLNWLKDKPREALAILISTKRILNEEVDKILILEVLGLEFQILRHLGEVQACNQILTKLLLLTRKTQDYLNRRIINRIENKKNSWRIGEDLLGDLRDDVDPQNALKKIFETGFYYLIPEVLKLDRSKGYIVLDMQLNSITILKFGEVLHLANAITPMTRKLLLLLSDHKLKTKEDLIKDIWGYNYNPLVHDPIIYNHFSRLRKKFGKFRSVISISENGYFLSSNYTVKHNMNLSLMNENSMNYREEVNSDSNISLYQNNDLPTIESDRSKYVNELGTNPDGLNHRQIQILKWLLRNDYVDIQKHQYLFKVSPITATRDLSGLQKMGLVKRIGRARATKYSKLY